MLFVLIVDHIGNVFLYFDLYGHGKLDLKFVLGRAEKVCWKQQDLSNNLHISEGEIAEEDNRTTSLEKKVCLFADTFTQVSNCYPK